MKFWFKTFVYLLLIGGLTLALSLAVRYLLNAAGLDFILASLLTCILVVFILICLFVFFYKSKKKSPEFVKIVKKYMDSIDLLQNVLFFLLFPFLGILLSVDKDVPASATTIRQILGGTLLTLKITMLIIKYIVKEKKEKIQENAA